MPVFDFGSWFLGFLVPMSTPLVGTHATRDATDLKQASATKRVEINISSDTCPCGYCRAERVPVSTPLVSTHTPRDASGVKQTSPVSLPILVLVPVSTRAPG